VTGSENHATLMDDVYRYQRYIYDFTRKYYLFGRDRLIRELDLKPGERLIEVGCGTARNLIAMARRYPQARLYGLDASQEMLKTAEQAIARAGLTGRIRLVHAYAEALTPALFGETEPFDRAVFSYSLSMIPDWRQALRAASETLAPDGRIHVVDFGDLTGLGSAGAWLIAGWLRLFHVQPRVEILHSLESRAATNTRTANGLRILFARYAFILCSGRESVLQIAH
jgi:S-adenosylmethionine-diacylgycerolhomoserine-N-methlytransferase